MINDSPIRALPSDTEVERSILSCALQDGSCLLELTKLPDEVFYIPGNQILARRMKTLAAQEGGVSLIALTIALREAGELEQVGGAINVTELEMFAPTTTSWATFRRSLIALYRRREAIVACTEAVGALYDDGESDPMELISTAVSRVWSTYSGRDKYNATIAEATTAYVKGLNDRLLGKFSLGRKTRWESFNREYGGLQDGLMLVCAETSGGKSTFASNLVEDIALLNSESALVYSLELDPEEIAERHLASLSSVPGKKLVLATADQLEMQQVMEASDILKQASIHMRTNPSQTIDQIAADCRIMASQLGNVGIIVIDYAQIVPTIRSRGETKEQAVNAIGAAAKRLQRELMIPVVLLSQLNDDGRIRDSRALGQHSNFTVTLTKEGLRIDKWRRGNRGITLPIVLDGPHYRMIER